MTAPRQVIPGRTYLISRRCTQRQYLLRPDARVEQIFLYCLGEAAARHDITLHGWIAMSNHEHLIVRDNHGNLPEFLGRFHKMVAKALNAHWSRWENLWAAEQANAVYLVDADDRFDKLVYLLANPVASDLVEHVADWPGACSFGLHLRASAQLTVKRPKGFFRADGPMPETATLRLERLHGFERLTHDEWVTKLQSTVRAAEARARERRIVQKVSVLGRKQVLRAKSHDTPSTSVPRRRLRPDVACRNLGRRIEALAALRGFRARYRTALSKWLAGERQVPFPTGTYRMLAFGVCCPPNGGAAEPSCAPRPPA